MPLIEQISWFEVDEKLPDADLTVLARITDADEPVWLAFYNGEGWLDVTGMTITVSRWAELPTGDPR